LFKIAVLISGNGSNLQSIIDNINTGSLNCKIEAVISDKDGAYGLERAKANNIKTFCFDRRLYGQNISDEILKVTQSKVDFIVLAGFLSVLTGNMLKVFKDKIINIHPALIPSFCGNKMYGIKVHEKAIEYGVKVSGCTVHFVDEGTDTGPILLQRMVPVLFSDTAKELQRRVLTKEHEALTEALNLIIEGKVKVVGRKVEIKGEEGVF
jgi:phosphoribosylglycinamide formyltransferase 1